jgi:hypothetical protein
MFKYKDASNRYNLLERNDTQPVADVDWRFLCGLLALLASEAPCYCRIVQVGKCARCQTLDTYERAIS